MSLEREPHQLTRHTDLLVRSPTPPSMDGLRAKGYRIRELILPHPAGGLYFEGITATKRIDGVKVQVYVGSDDGELFFTPQAYVNDRNVGQALTPEKAARIAEFRALIERHRDG